MTTGSAGEKAPAPQGSRVLRTASAGPANQQPQAEDKLHRVQRCIGEVKPPEARQSGWRRVAGEEVEAPAKRDDEPVEREQRDGERENRCCTDHGRAVQRSKAE